MYNKCDLIDAEQRTHLAAAQPDSQQISALEGTGVRGLLYRIAQEASRGDTLLTVLVPYDKGLLMKMVHERCQVLSERYVQGGLMATVMASARMAETLAPYVCEDDGQEPEGDAR